MLILTYMASSKTIGISLIWEQMQLISLVEYGGTDDFDDEDGYVSNGDDGFDDEETTSPKQLKKEKVTPKSSRAKPVQDDDEDEDDTDY